MRYKFKELFIENTRKCNLQCPHCLKGDSQNISMSTELIDTVFSNVIDCERITFGSGESLLEMDCIDYFVDKIITYNWHTMQLQLTTNGTILDKKICDIYEKFCKSKLGRTTLIRISDDNYHDRKQSLKAYDFYKPIIEKINIRIGYKAITLSLTTANETTANTETNDIKWLVYSGRAVNYISENKNKFNPVGSIPVKHPFLFDHRIKIENDVVFCTLLVSANGNIGFFEERSYELNDKLAFGNILNNDISTIIDRYNDNCLLRCEECTLLNTYGKQCRFIPDIAENSRIFYSVAYDLLQKYLLTRKIAKETFKNVPTQDIITDVPIPDNVNVFLGLIKSLYSKFTVKSEANNLLSMLDKNTVSRFLEDYKKSKSKDEMDDRVKLLSAKVQLQDDDTYVLPNNTIGNKNDLLNCEAFKHLKWLNNEYGSGRMKASNTKVFICTPPEVYN